jgi:hypothetical protein
VFEVELERIFNFSMTCGQNIEMKIDIDRLYSGSCDHKLATQSDRGNVVKYGNSGPMYPCSK